MGEIESSDRRKFLKSAGKFAAATPPAIALLMSTTLEANAIGRSGGRYKTKHVYFKRRVRPNSPKGNNKNIQSEK